MSTYRSINVQYIPIEPETLCLGAGSGQNRVSLDRTGPESVCLPPLLLDCLRIDNHTCAHSLELTSISIYTQPQNTLGVCCIVAFEFY